MDDADVESVEQAAPVVSVHDETTRRVCPECRGDVLLMGPIGPPSLEDLKLPICWTSCAVAGPANKPSWWLCPKTRVLDVPGVYRLRIERIELLE